MSKITFRADDELVERLEALDASKSEVMREALRVYLDGAERRRETPGTADAGAGETASDEPSSLDDVLAARVDDLITQRLDARLGDRTRRPQDVNVNVTLDGVSGRVADEPAEASQDRNRKTRETDADDAATTAEKTCDQCGEATAPDHVYCPNCGGKTSHRVFCECGDELRSDWAFCPGCGRRTSAADVLERR